MKLKTYKKNYSISFFSKLELIGISSNQYYIIIQYNSTILIEFINLISDESYSNRASSSIDDE